MLNVRKKEETIQPVSKPTEQITWLFPQVRKGSEKAFFFINGQK